MYKRQTQEYVANKIGLPQSKYSDIETGAKKNVDTEVLAKIAEVLDVSVEEITNPMPLVINFHNSSDSYNTPFGSQTNQLNEKLIDELSHQLSKKDEQIAALLKSNELLVKQTK